MGQFTCEFREIPKTKTVVLDIRNYGKLVRTITGDSKKNALLRAISEMDHQAEVGKSAESIGMFLRTVNIDK